jgi:ankyrin repeat protein
MIKVILNVPAGDDSEIFGQSRHEIVELVGRRNADSRLCTRYHLPLISFAAAEGEEEVVRVLLKQKVDPDQRSPRQQTPLHFVRDPEVAELLLKAKADINAQNVEGQTSLDKATEERKSQELIAFLRAHGAQEGDRAKRAFWNCSREQAFKFESAG